MNLKPFAYVLLCALAACSGEKEQNKTPLVTAEGDHLTLSEADKADFLKVVAAERDRGGQIQLPGRLVWNETRTVRVFPQVGGRIAKALVDVGDTVKQGQTLALLSSAEYGEAQSDAHKADADARLARQSLTRSKELRDAGIIAEKDWQAAQADAARADAESARANRRLSTLGGDGEGNYALKTPIAGVIVARNLNPGMEFRPDQDVPALFTITDPTHLWLQLDASETDLRNLKVGQAITIDIKQFPGEHFAGTIRHVADFVDPQSRTIKVRCDVGNADRRLKGEMFAQATIPVEPSGQLQVPASAVMLIGKQRFVLVEESAGHYRRQRVETGAERDGRTEIQAGLKLGDRVISEGNLNLIKYFKSTVETGK